MDVSPSTQKCSSGGVLPREATAMLGFSQIWTGFSQDGFPHCLCVFFWRADAGNSHDSCFVFSLVGFLLSGDVKSVCCWFFVVWFCVCVCVLQPLHSPPPPPVTHVLTNMPVDKAQALLFRQPWPLPLTPPPQPPLHPRTHTTTTNTCTSCLHFKMGQPISFLILYD